LFIELGAIFNQIAENVMNTGALAAPYFSQWETASMTLPVLERGAATLETIRFHNPSGHDVQSQADVVLSLPTFDRFFANCGVAITL
jgi:hypothetical protein